jgi:hypothetical protein
MCLEHCLVDVISVHQNLMIARPPIELGEESRAV